MAPAPSCSYAISLDDQSESSLIRSSMRRDKLLVGKTFGAVLWAKVFSHVLDDLTSETRLWSAPLEMDYI